MVHPMSPSSSSDDSPYDVYWKSESILASIPAFRTASTSVGMATRTPVKRNTTAALLPSPSTSTSHVQPIRLSKKRRQVRPGTLVTPTVNAAERMDEATLKTMEVLAARLSGRSAGTPSSAARRSGGKRELVSIGTVSVDKGKGRQKENAPSERCQKALTSRRSLPLALPGPAPLRPSSSGSSILNHLLSSKPFLPAESKRVQLPIDIPDTPLLSKSILSSKPALSPETDEFDSYFDDKDFELALSQIDDFGSLPSSSICVPPGTMKKMSPVSSLARVAGPPIRSSPRIASKTASIPSRSIPPPPQPILRRPTLPTPRPDARMAPIVASRPNTVATKFKAVSPKRAVIVRGTGAGVKLMDEQAKKEMEALLDGVGDWSDEDF